MSILFKLVLLISDSMLTCWLFSQQAIPIERGYIEYEKKINLYAVVGESMLDNVNAESILENYKKSFPQFQYSHFRLYFENNQTLWQPTDSTVQNDIVSQVTSKSVTFTNLLENEIISQKSIFDVTFLVKDSCRKIEWKIKDEMREIAGYECRRANALIFDSIYVVAFYTTQIVPQGGPEFFNGLPGMILGIALPHEHIFWFATKVSDQIQIDILDFIPSAGRPTSFSKLKDDLSQMFTQLGTSAARVIFKNVMY